MQKIGETLDAAAASVQDVGVDHRGLDVTMAEKLLDGTDIIAGFQERWCRSIGGKVDGVIFGELIG